MGTSSEGVFTLSIPSFPKGIIMGDTSEPLLSIAETSTAQKYEVGTKLVYSDGRVFRYVKNGGTALAKGLMTASEALYARVINEAQSTSGVNVEVGDQEITIDVTTGGTYVEDEFSGGFLSVRDGTGAGDMYKILANKITSTDTLMTVLLETPIRTAWDATTEISLVKSPWRDVDVQPTTAEGTPAGVPLVAVAANSYFWGQTGGYCCMLIDTGDTIVKGEPAGKPGTNAVAGAVGLVANDGTDLVYGVAVEVAATAEYGIIDLKLDS